MTDSTLCERSVFYPSLAVLLVGEGLSIRFAEIPGLYGFSFVGDDLPIGRIDETGSSRTSFLVPVSEVLLEFIGIIGAVVGFPGELPVLALRIKIGVRSGCHEYGFHLFFMISVGDFGKSSEVIFEGEFIHHNKFPSFIEEDNFPSKYVVVHGSGGIPCGFAVPVRESNKVCPEFYHGEWIFFLPENECDFIGSKCFERKFYIFFEGS